MPTFTINAHAWLHCGDHHMLARFLWMKSMHDSFLLNTTILVILHAIEFILLNWINSVDNLSYFKSRGMTIHQINLDYRWPTQLKSLCHYCAAHLCKCPAGGYSLSLAYQKQHCSFMFTVNHVTMWKTDFTDPQDLFPPTPTRTERKKKNTKGDLVQCHGHCHDIQE